MPFTLTMPKLSPTMEEGMIAKWVSKVGDYVEVGDVMMEVATDKATVEHTAIDSGYLKKIIVREGEEAVVNQPIAIFTETKDESIEGYEPKGFIPAAAQASPATEKVEPESSKEKTQKPATLMGQAVFTPEAPLEGYRFEHRVEIANERLKVSPLARKMAKEKGLDISTVAGSGPGGRIVKEDLERAPPAGDFVMGKREMPQHAPGSYEEEKLSQIQKVISQRLQQAKMFIPHFYVEQNVDVDALLALREQMTTLDIKVSINDCIVRACALALRKHPDVNSGFNSENNTIIRFKTIDISVAVSTPSGLITPIIRHTDHKNLEEISIEMRALGQRAKEGKLEGHEYKGGSFTVSNLGMFGVTSFKAIINPPQAAIVAVSGIHEVPIVKQGNIVVGKVMKLTLSADHRVIDGVAAAKFLNTLKYYLENPISLIL